MRLLSNDVGLRALIGYRLGQHKILRELGAGGMGKVYVAFDVKTEREVALKVLPPELAATPERLARFRSEAKILAKLKNPHIVTVYQVGSDIPIPRRRDGVEGSADGVPVNYFTMELVVGRTLRESIPESGLPVEPLIRLATELCSALQAAHAREILHRDLNPRNIMLDEAGLAKVLDFGLAKRQRRRPSEKDGTATAELSTEAGTVLGTLPYMSPEQVRGERVGRPTDLFSLGVVLYEAATGKCPFAGKSRAELTAAIQRDSPPPLATLRPDLPLGLTQAVELCLVKEASRRLDRCERVLELLQGGAAAIVTATTVTQLRPPSGREGIAIRHAARARYQGDRRMDVLLYVALSEEFAYLSDQLVKSLGGELTFEEDRELALTYYFTSVRSSVLGRRVEVVLIPAGKMGNTRAGVVVSAALSRFKPRDLVVLGLAGSLSGDLQPGSVFVPDVINEYLANSAGVGREQWEFMISGNRYRTNPRLLNRIQQFPSTARQEFEGWRQRAHDDAAELIDEPTRRTLASLGAYLEGTLVAGDDRVLASGPAVGKGKAFVDWLRTTTDRKTAAIEMESAGVFDASQIRDQPPRTIAIRGISDFADERKEMIEESSRGQLRKLAMRNSLSLLWAALESGLLGGDLQDTAFATESPDSPPPPREPDPTYIPCRETEVVLREIDQSGAACVFAPFHFGKSTFLDGLLVTLQEDHRIVELRPRMVPDVTSYTEFLKWVSLKAADSVGHREWVEEAWNAATYGTDRFEWLLERRILPASDLPLLLAIDDGEKILENRSARSFYVLLRDFNKRYRPPWKRFRALVTTGRTLHQLKRAYGPDSFFLHTRTVPLGGFDSGQVAELAQQLGVPLKTDAERKVVETTGGHPYLVRRLLEESSRCSRPVEALLGTAEHLFADHLADCAARLEGTARSALRELLADSEASLSIEGADHLVGLGIVRIVRNRPVLRCPLYRHLETML